MKALTGHKLLADQTRATDAQKQVGEAGASWDKALAESNPKGKKACTDEEVMAATLHNDAEANLWMNKFDEAEMLPARHKLLAISRYSTVTKELGVMV